MYQNRLVAGLCPGWLGNSERLPDSLAGFRGPLCGGGGEKGREEEMTETKGGKEKMWNLLHHFWSRRPWLE